MKEGVLMRTKEQPDMEIDWESFTGVDRTKAAKKQTSEEDVSPKY